MKTIVGGIFGGCAIAGWGIALATNNDFLLVASGLMAIAFAIAYFKED